MKSRVSNNRLIKREWGERQVNCWRGCSTFFLVRRSVSPLSWFRFFSASSDLKFAAWPFWLFFVARLPPPSPFWLPRTSTWRLPLRAAHYGPHLRGEIWGLHRAKYSNAKIAGMVWGRAGRGWAGGQEGSHWASQPGSQATRGPNSRVAPAARTCLAGAARRLRRLLAAAPFESFYHSICGPPVVGSQFTISLTLEIQISF